MSLRFRLFAASTIAEAALPWLQRQNLCSKNIETATAVMTAENRSKVMNWTNKKKEL